MDGRGLASEWATWLILVLGLMNPCAASADTNPLNQEMGVQAAGQTAEQNQLGQPVSSMSTTELLQRAPRVEREAIWESTGREWVNDPCLEELGRRFDLDGFTDAEWRLALEQTQAIFVRSRWPRDRDLVVGIIVPGWMQRARIIVIPRMAGLSPAAGYDTSILTSGNDASALHEMGKYSRLGRVPDGTTSLAFEVSVERLPFEAAPDEDRRPKVLWCGVMNFPIDLVDSVDQAMLPISNEEADRVISRCVSVGCFRSHRNDDVQCKLVCDQSLFPVLEHMAVSVEIEMLRDGIAVSRTKLRARQSPLPACVGRTWHVYRSNVESVSCIDRHTLTDAHELGRWAVRIRGVSDDVLCMWQKTSFWAGDVTIPLSDVVVSPVQGLSW